MTVSPTLGLADAAHRTWDALVVGAGPAGALAARELARRGASVLLVDRASFPRWKVCGCCINDSALATLAAAGLGELPLRLGAVPIADLYLATGRQQAVLPLHRGVALSRTAFDAALIEEAVEAGAAFLPGTRAALAEVVSEPAMQLRQGDKARTVRGRVVLAANGLSADGTRTSPRSAIGAGTVVETAPAFYRSGTIFMACGRSGYAGLVRLEDGRLDVAAALHPALIKSAGGLARAVIALLADAGLPPLPGLADCSWRGTPALTRRARQVASERRFVLGDAAGFVEPFTGEGIAWALAAALAVAPLAWRAVHRWHPDLAREWEAGYRRTVARRQLACRLTAVVLRSPALTAFLVACLARAPGLASPLVRHLNTAPQSETRIAHANGPC